jgi:AraC family transcriptional regulator
MPSGYDMSGPSADAARSQVSKKTTIIGADELHLVQQNGDLPITLAAGSAPGENGVSLLRTRFHGGMHFSATPRQHLIWFQLSNMRIECRRGGRKLTQEVSVGSLAICPAGIDCAADAEDGGDIILVAVDPAQLALATAEDSVPEAQLIERLSGCDDALLELARSLVVESAHDYPNGPLFWNEAASAFIGRLAARHTSGHESQMRGRLGKRLLERLRNYIMAHLDEAIEVADLAALAGRSPYHFSRVFSRSVGISPHRYVVHLRLQRAVELIRDGRSSLAEIAAQTGFADQSHLSRWVRRVHSERLIRAKRQYDPDNVFSSAIPLPVNQDKKLAAMSA